MVTKRKTCVRSQLKCATTAKEANSLEDVEEIRKKVEATKCIRFGPSSLESMDNA